MRITYDLEADALYIAFGEGPATVEEVGEGIALDPTFRTPFTPAGNIARPPGGAPRSRDGEPG